jgi:ABC-type multidrug transport system permease subunit
MLSILSGFGVVVLGMLVVGASVAIIVGTLVLVASIFCGKDRR